jgi:hypothetical protein
MSDFDDASAKKKRSSCKTSGGQFYADITNRLHQATLLIATGLSGLMTWQTSLILSMGLVLRARAMGGRHEHPAITLLDASACA